VNGGIVGQPVKVTKAEHSVANKHCHILLDDPFFNYFKILRVIQSTTAEHEMDTRDGVQCKFTKYLIPYHGPQELIVSWP